MPPTRNLDHQHNKLVALAMFALTSVVAGLLIAGLIVPFAAVFGAGAAAGARAINQMPDDYEAPAQFEGSKVYLSDGSLLASFAEQDRKYVTLDQIAPIMRKAQVAIEDHRFYEHGALDFRGFMRALVKGGGGQGGSSLSQQYVKQVQIQIAIDNGDKKAEAKAQERSLSRKVQELRRAMAVEHKFSKDQILEKYLNIAYYGDGSYGVESAAQHFFGVSAKDLSLPQAALLAGMVQNPSATDPVNHPKAGIERRNVVLDRMTDELVTTSLKKIAPTDLIVTREQAEQAKQMPFEADKVKPRANGCVGSRYPFICQYAQIELLKTTSLRGSASTEAEAQQNAMNILNRKGLSVTVSVDPRYQDAAEKRIHAVLDPTDPVIGLMSSIEPGSGRIIMMAQSRNVMGQNVGAGETFWNYNASQEYGGAEGYQPGSTFKTFAAAAAFDKGIPMSKTYDNYSHMDFSSYTWDLCNGQRGVTEAYKPINFGDFKGRADMKKAAAASVNTYFLQLEHDAGLCNTARMADAAGVQLASGKTVADFAAKDGPVPSMVLGAAEVVPLSLTNSFATYGARGVRCNPHLVDKILKQDKSEFPINPSGCEQVLKQDVMDAVNHLLNSNIKSDYYYYVNTRVPVGGAYPRYDMGGKTGTTNTTQTALMVTYTPDLSTQVLLTADKLQAPFIGVLEPDIREAPLKKIGRIREAHATLQPIAGNYWSDVLPLTKGTKFVAPKPEYVSGRDVTVPTLGRTNIDADDKALRDAGFYTERVQIASAAPAGTYLGYSPGGGQTVKSGVTIQLYVSSGRAATPTPTPAPSSSPASAPAPAPSSTAPPASAPPGGQPTQPRRT